MSKRVIILMGDPTINEERKATEAIKPGHLIMHASATTCSKNTANGADVARAFALERDELGKGIDDTYSNDAGASAYAANDYVKEAVCYPGCRVNAWIPSGQNISAGNYLQADNAGRLVVYASGARLARALEAVNATAGDARIRVEIV
jgi:hypothetical protein